MKEEKLNIFIPAMALQNPANPPDINLNQKLRFAVLRFFFTKDFYGLISVRDPLPGVFLEEYKLNAPLLGYDVSAIVRC